MVESRGDVFKEKKKFNMMSIYFASFMFCFVVLMITSNMLGDVNGFSCFISLLISAIPIANIIVGIILGYITFYIYLIKWRR
jgi:hypothetical protein